MSRRGIPLFFGVHSPLLSPSSPIFSSSNTTPTLNSEISEPELLTQARYTPVKPSTKTSKMKCAEVFNKGFEPERPGDEKVSTTATVATSAGPAAFGPALSPTDAANGGCQSDSASASSGLSSQSKFSSQSKLVEKFLGPERLLMNAENHNLQLKEALKRALNGKNAAEEIIARQRKENPAIDTDIKNKELKAALDEAIAARKAADKIAARKVKECADLAGTHAEDLKAEKKKHFDHMNHLGKESIVEERRYQDQIHDLEEKVKELTDKVKEWKKVAKGFKNEVKETEELFGIEVDEIVADHEAAIKALKEAHEKAIELLIEEHQTQTETHKTNDNLTSDGLTRDPDALVGILVRKHETDFAALKKSHEEAVEVLKQDHETIIGDLMKRHNNEFEHLATEYVKQYKIDHAALKQYQEDTENETEALKKEYNKKLRGIKQDYDLKLQAMQYSTAKVNFEDQSLTNSASRMKLENSAPAKMGRSKSVNAVGLFDLASPTRQGRKKSSNILSKLGYSPPNKMSRTPSKNTIGSTTDNDGGYKETREEWLARLERDKELQPTLKSRFDALGLYNDEVDEDEEAEIERCAKEWVWTEEQEARKQRDMKILNDAYPRLCAEAVARRDEQEAKEPGSTRDWIVPEFEEGVPFIPNGQRFVGLRWYNMMPLGMSPHLQ